MHPFIVNAVLDPDANPFDRQERIAWWSQERISQAKVMVVGAGAIGNETLKNLALLGVRNMFIVDMDTISTSNLSRTVLFRKSDVGRSKAEVAAERTRELSLADDVNIDWFHGDVVWELGTGIYREMDVVLGCLDNAETRFAVNRHCWLANTPWIDAGIYELGMHVSVFVPPSPPCYQCNASKEQLAAARQRYSCDDFKRSMLREGKAATVQIASAIASALQVQETMKLICGQPSSAGKMLYFQGKINDFDLLQLPPNPECMACATYPEVVTLPLSTGITLKFFLQYVSEEQLSGEGATLDLRSDRTFVVSAACRTCGCLIEFLRPSFRIYDSELICASCAERGRALQEAHTQQPTEKVLLYEFDLLQTEERILDMRLHDLGIPFAHIVGVRDTHGGYKYYELSSDKAKVMPNITCA